MKTRTPLRLSKGKTAAKETSFASDYTTRPDEKQRDAFLNLLKDTDQGWGFDQFLRRGPRAGVTEPTEIVKAVAGRLVAVAQAEPAKRGRYLSIFETIDQHFAEALQCAQYAADYAAYQEHGQQEPALQAMRGKPITDAQKHCLNTLGWRGDMPGDRADAYVLISRLLAKPGGSK